MSEHEQLALFPVPGGSDRQHRDLFTIYGPDGLMDRGTTLACACGVGPVDYCARCDDEGW